MTITIIQHKNKFILGHKIIYTFNGKVYLDDVEGWRRAKIAFKHWFNHEFPDTFDNIEIIEKI